MKNKKGQMWNIFTFVIFAFLVILVFAGMIYEMGLINNVFTQVGLQNDQRGSNYTGYTNMTQASQMTFGTLNVSIQALHMVAIVYILGLAIMIIVTNSLIKIHPLFFFPYVLLTGLAVILAVPISNAYQSLLTSNLFGGELNNFLYANYILANLPTITMFVGLVGAVFLFVGIIRNQGDSLQ